PDQSGCPGAYHLLVDDRLAHDVGTLAAVLGRPGERQVPGLVDLPLPGFRQREAARIAPFHVALVALSLRDVLLEPVTHGVLEGALRGRVGEIHRRESLARPP